MSRKAAKIYLKIPLTLNQRVFSKRVFDQMVDALDKIYDREKARLHDEISEHGKNIYNEIISYYYSTYTPKMYDRHGKIEGFNLYNAERTAWDTITSQENELFGFYPDYNKLLYYTEIEPYRKRDGEPVVKVEVDREGVLDFILKKGKRSMPPWAGKPLKFNAKVSYASKGFYFKGSGKPTDIMNRAADRLVKHYNKQIIKRILAQFKSLDKKWVV